MIGIQSIGIYLPEGRIDNRERMEKFSIEEEFLHNKTGMLRLAIKNKDDETSDLCCKAFADLQRRTHIRPEDIDCIVVCTQNPDGHGLPHTSAIVHGKLNLSENCAAFDISLGCSGFVYGLSIIQSFMLANGLKNGILFTADPYSKVINSEDKNTSLLFGDGATATFLSDTPIWLSGKFVFGSQGRESTAIAVETQAEGLSMNGRSVFTFSATSVPKNIRAMLEVNNLSVDDIDYFLLHQGSRYIVETLRKKLDVDEKKAPFKAADYGNTVSSSIPIMLSDIEPDAKRVALAGFGVGLSWASVILFRNEGKK